VASLALVLAASVVMLVMSFFEHARSARSPTILNTYLAFTLLFDIVQLRTLWLNRDTTNQLVLAGVFTFSVALKVVILLQEAQNKTKWTLWDESEHSPEEYSSIYSLSVYYWLRRLFAKGYTSILKDNDLYSLDQTLSARTAASKLEKSLQSQKARNGSNSLRMPLVKSFVLPFLAPVVPELFLIGFQYSQAFFIQAVIQYLEDSNGDPNSFGYGLIGACGLIYVGMAISNSFYSYYAERAATLVRAALCALVYRKTTQATIETTSEAASVTLMSRDVLAICQGVRTMHLLWSSLVQVALGCWLLYTKLGPSFITPIASICICSAILSWVMKFARKRQTVWMEKIQVRVALTAAVISDMKLFKMLGMSDNIAEMINERRGHEIVAGTGFRTITAACFTLAFVPVALSPVLAFALTFEPLDASALFISLSFITILTTPTTSLLQSIPNWLAALASLRRIEKYLAEPPRQDRRQEQASAVEETDEGSGSDIPLANLGAPCKPVFQITNGSFGWDSSKLVLKDINVAIPRSKLTCVVGPVASGKSSLCNALLGEMPISRGTTETSVSRYGVGYCAQTPFLRDETIRDSIVGNNCFKQTQYSAIMDATMLLRDVENMANGDGTKVGSNGAILSGGQRQRVSVARALYAEKEVMIFDDVLSGLDANTETEVFKRVFGSQGIIRCRGATAILCTHSVRHLASADHIIVLGNNGHVVEQGSFEQLSRNGSYVSSLAIDRNNSEPESSVTEQARIDFVPSAENSAEDHVDSSRRVGDRAVYMHYFRSINRLAITSFAVLALVSGFCTNFSPIWISYWAADAFHQPKSFYIGIYALLRVVEIMTIGTAAAIGLTLVVSSSGLSLHKTAINTVAKAPLSFLTSTNTGTVTNLFSQDMTLIDGELPVAFLNTVLNVITLLGYFFVVAVASPYIALGYIPLGGLLYGIQMFYLRTSRQLRLLDLEMKTPL
jgi:ABC-type multidrug transport system fused ATPase/permease subunit